MRTSPRRLTAAAVLLATALGGTLSSGSTADAAPDRGDGAVASAADRYGVSETALSQRLRTDPSFRLTPSGVAISVDPAPTGTPTHGALMAQAFPLAATFDLHSKPGSQRTIYLDFDGQNVSNTVWNTNFDGNGPGQPVPNGFHPAMDLAGDGAAFNNNELLQVQDIFQRVAEDYAPFDVDVTTEVPLAASLDRTNAADQVYGVRALVSPSTTAAGAICQNACGGVAFIRVFNHYAGLNNDPPTHEQYQPAWVFPQLLIDGNQVKNIAEATTHEVGHNLGLDHDGTNTAGYYAGHNGWAPIMGTGYTQPIVQFALSDYPGANLGGPGAGSAQANADDLETITNFLSPAAPLLDGHPEQFRTDEPGTSTGNAGAVPATGAYIHNRLDVDVLALGTCSGDVTVTASNAPVSPNLDIELQLLNSGGTVIDIDNPASAFFDLDTASGLDAAVSGTALPAGQYYARVDGVGRGTALNGYTDYGSIGAYTLEHPGCDGIVPAKPGKPRIGRATPGKRGGAKTAKIAWRPPAAAANPAINGYRVIAYRKNNNGKYVQVSPPSPVYPASKRFTTYPGNGTYKFAVMARNARGFGALSAKSNAVRTR